MKKIVLSLAFIFSVVISYSQQVWQLQQVNPASINDSSYWQVTLHNAPYGSPVKYNYKMRTDSLVKFLKGKNIIYIDTIYRIAGKDSVYYKKDGNTYAFKDSVENIRSTPYEVYYANSPDGEPVTSPEFYTDGRYIFLDNADSNVQVGTFHYPSTMWISASKNTIIGSNAGFETIYPTTLLKNVIAIGNNAWADKNNEFVFGNDSVINWKIRGIEYVMPPDNGNAGEFLKTDGNGTLTWDSTAVFSPDSVTAHAWSLQGNSGIDTSISFIGTTDAMPLMLRINNNRWGGFGIVDGSIFLGQNAGSGATDASNSNFLGANAGYNAAFASSSNFLGYWAGHIATFADNSNFLGSYAGDGATDANNSNFLGANAGNGATDANNSNFLGNSAGYSATFANNSNFLGANAGNGATNAFYSNFLGNYAGAGATDANNAIFIGYYAGSFSADNLLDNSSGGTSILIGDSTSTGGFSNSIAIGKGATNTAANQLYISDDITETVTAGGVTIGGGVKLNGIPAYADDAAAGAGGLSTGSLYQTSGAGAAPLNVAGILMIKQ